MEKGTVIYVGNFELPDKNAAAHRVMNNGKIDAFDTHDNLIKSNKIYQEIYTLQNDEGGDFDNPYDDNRKEVAQ